MYWAKAGFRMFFEKIKKRIHLQRWGLPLFVFLLAFIPRTLSLDTFLTADEDDQLQFSAQFLEAVSHHDWAGAVVLGYPGVPTLSLGALGIWLTDEEISLTGLTTALGSVFESIALIAESVGASATKDLHSVFLPLVTGSGTESKTILATVLENPLGYVQTVRLLLVFTAALVMVVIFLALRRLLDQRLALVAVLMLAFDPFIMAHSRLIHVDAPLSYFMFAAFVTFIVYLNQDGQDGRWWLLASGVLGALGVLSKTPGIILGSILVISGLFYTWLADSGHSRRLLLKRLLVALGVWGIVAAVAFFAFWPSMWVRPIFALQHIIENVLSVGRFDSHPTSGIFWGVTRGDRNPFYYLITIPFHLTPLSLGGLLVGLGMIVVGFIQRKRNIQSIASKYLPFLLSLLAYSILFVVPVSYVAGRGDRYILPVSLGLDVIAALGLWGGGNGHS